MTLYATVGSKALYLLFVWLVSSAAAGWMADRKGYGERLGLTFGLLLTAVGFLIVCLLPGRPGSAWKLEGPLPRRSRRRATADAPDPRAGGGSSGGPPSGSPPTPSASGGPPAQT
jgi:hypothetical protein